MTKRTHAKQHRIYDYKYGVQDEKNEKGESTGVKVPYLHSVENRPEVLPAKPRQEYTFEMDGLRVTVMMSDGQVINKYKAFKRFCESKGGYDTAMREQNMMDPKDLPQLTKLTEEGIILSDQSMSVVQ